MPNYLEILRLDSLNYSQRTIESTAHCSRHTVRSVLQAAKEKRISKYRGTKKDYYDFLGHIDALLAPYGTHVEPGK